jgi:hypothetical protein
MKMKKHWLEVWGLTICAVIAACDEQTPSDSGATSATSSSSGSSTSSGMGGDGGGGAGVGVSDCFSNPMTHVEIINACTDAEKVDKVVKLPLLEPDGSLPPLP